MTRTTGRLWCAGLALCGAIVGTASFAFADSPVSVVQRGRSFSVAALTIKAGDVVRFLNEDGFIHHLFVKTPSFQFDSDEQEPGRDVSVRFTERGTFDVRCAIHPKMALRMDVR